MPGSAKHSGSSDEEKRKLDDALEVALEETFPASDAVSLTQPLLPQAAKPAKSHRN